MRDKSKVWMDVRTGVIWYDGSPMTPEDVVWSFTHAGSPKSGNPVFFIWCGINNFKIDGNRIIADVVQYNPVLFKWMAFLSRLRLAEGLLRKGLVRRASKRSQSALAPCSMHTRATPIYG
jgi:peptide/nickel transport system substrate-binding protein